MYFERKRLSDNPQRPAMIVEEDIYESKDKRRAANTTAVSASNST
jgi:hypothetical protein